MYCCEQRLLMDNRHTEKVATGESGIRVERERVINHAEYEDLLLQSDKNLNTISKIRYTFTENNLMFELDVYPALFNNQAILEVELSDINDDLELPTNVEIIKEVTDDKSFSNYALAQIQK